MAKFKIDVEIDWLGEDGTLDDQIKESIKDEIIEKIGKTVMNDIRKTAASEAKNRIGLWVNNYLATLVKEKKIPYSKNSWNSETNYISIEEMIGMKFEEALKQTVDKNGKPTSSSYDSYGTMLDWLTGQQARKYANEKVQEFVKDIKGDIEAYTSKKVKDEMMKQLTASLISNIDFNKVFKEE